MTQRFATIGEMPFSAPAADAPDASRDRQWLMAFTPDPKVEAALRDGLADILTGQLDIRRGGASAAISTLSRLQTPRLLIVDVSGERDPLQALDGLSDVSEPDVRVLVIGDLQDVDFYRQLTRGLGVAEYLAKPVTRDAVSRLFGPLVRGDAQDHMAVSGGRSISLTGTSGGAGATTIAGNLAWHLSAAHRRHTCLLDSDLHLGGAGLLLDAPLGPGLRAALRAPERIDRVLLERAVQTVNLPAVEGRLSLMASEENISADVEYEPGAASRLLYLMRQRYNVVVADVGFRPSPFQRELLDRVDQRVLVMEPTIAGLRGVMRLLEVPAGSSQARRPVLVLNRLGKPGSLSRQQVEETLKLGVDVVIPELTRKAIEAANLGRLLAASRGPFRDAMDALARLVSVQRTEDASSTTSTRQRGVSVFGRRLVLPRIGRR